MYTRWGHRLLDVQLINFSKNWMHHLNALCYSQINIGTGTTGAFSIAADAALGMTLKPPFSPYSDSITFLHGAYIFEDVGVTAYSVRLILPMSQIHFTSSIKMQTNTI